MKTRMIWRNGRFLGEEHAVVSLYDTGAMWGSAVFEMCRTFGGATFRLEQHVARLARSFEYVNPEPRPHIPWIDVVEAHEELLDYHRREFPDEPEWRTLIHVSPGPLPIYEHLPQEPLVIITCYPLRWVLRGHSGDYDGVRARFVTSDWGRDAQAKHRSRLPLRMAEWQAKSMDPAAVPILVREGRWVTESSGSNVFFVERGRLITPNRFCLPGISRAYVLELAQRLGIPTSSTADFSCEWAPRSTECFLTNTPFCIVPVTTLGSIPVGDGCVGPITQSLMRAWIDDVGVNFVAQARSFDR